MNGAVLPTTAAAAVATDAVTRVVGCTILEIDDVGEEVYSLDRNKQKTGYIPTVSITTSKSGARNVPWRRRRPRDGRYYVVNARGRVYSLFERRERQALVVAINQFFRTGAST